MKQLFCILFGCDYEWVKVQEFLGCVDALRCKRCGDMPGYPFGGAKFC